MDKRAFLKSLCGGSLAALFGERLWAHYADVPAQDLAQDEVFWGRIRSRYRLHPDFVNLENGYYSLASQDVLEAFVGHARDVNFLASRYMRTRQLDDKLAVRAALAAFAGCPADELIITRNTTESLDTVIAGFDWRPGDEAVMARQDYGAMLDMFALQARRHGLVPKFVSVPHDPRSDDEIVELYANAITDKTRLLMVCHLINITGQILPVRRIADMAHARGVQVMVDGAHSFAHLDFKIQDLGADYYGASLHKWLGSPLGAGILWVRKDRIPKLWPLFGDGRPDDDILRLNHTGTHPPHTDLAIRDALAFHLELGSARKEARLRFLQQYWTGKVRGRPRIEMFTPRDPARSCAIANVGITGMKPGELANVLFERFRIWTVPIDYAEVHGVRVTPHVHTSLAELDQLVAALGELAA